MILTCRSHDSHMLTFITQSRYCPHICCTSALPEGTTWLLRLHTRMMKELETQLCTGHMQVMWHTLWVPQCCTECLQLLHKCQWHHQSMLEIIQKGLQLSHNHEAEESVKSTETKDVNCFLRRCEEREWGRLRGGGEEERQEEGRDGKRGRRGKKEEIKMAKINQMFQF